MRSAFNQFSKEEIMNKKKWLAISMSLVVLSSIYIFGAVAANDVIDGYPPEESAVIEDNIIEGSALFFQAAADIMKLFDEAERGAKDLNFPNSTNMLDSAIAKLKMAKEKYETATGLGKSIDKANCNFEYLKVFDYDKLVTEKGLIKEVVEDVKVYLQTGNVPGFYQRISDEVGILIDRLNGLKIKMQVEIVTFHKSDYWGILQKLSGIMLLGNYGTVIGNTAYSDFHRQ